MSSKRRWVWLLVGGMLLSLTGCRSGTCSNCSLRDRLFPRRGMTVATPYVQEAPILEGAPTLSAPATIETAPLSSPSPTTTIEPAPSEPSLTPIPAPSAPGTNGSKAPGTSWNSNTRDSYRYGATTTPANPGENHARALLPTSPVTNTRSSSAKPVDTTKGNAAPADSLSELPPLNLPDDVVTTPRDISPPPADLAPLPETEKSPIKEEPSSRTPPPTSSPRQSPSESSSAKSALEQKGLSPPTTSTRTSQIDRSAEPRNVEKPDLSKAGSGFSVPGIVLFASLEPTLAAGSLPDTAGLDWLAEKGYKTLVDLRSSSESHENMIRESHQRGFRYLVLPIELVDLKSKDLEQFSQQLRLVDDRPVYFFDRDGSRASALWLVHRVRQDKLELAKAAQDARDLGFMSERSLELARRFLDQHPSAPTAALKLEDAPNPIIEIETKKKVRNLDRGALARQVLPALMGAWSSFYHVATTVDHQVPRPSDPEGWRPFAALLVSVLAAPLVYLTHAGVVTGVRRAQASLPAPAPSRKSLPRG